MNGSPGLPRVMGLRDVVLFNITAIVGLRWLTTAASQFGVAALPLWVVAMLVFFIPSALAVRELADIDPGAGGLYRWVSRAFGPRQGFLAGGLVPARFDFPSINLFATMTFAYAGLELAPSLGGEIHDPAATLRRGVLLSAAAIVAIYLLGTVAMLVALPRETVSITNGMPQATAALVARLDVPGLGWVAAIVAALLVLGNVGGVGAWLAGSARLP